MTDQPIPMNRGGFRGLAIPSARDAGRWLSLAATPTFAILSVVSLIRGGGPLEVLCAASGQGWPIGNMGLMYGLMGVFHLPPWTRLLERHQQE